MDVEWDEAKRQENIRRHGLDFVGAERIFDGDTVTVEDTRRSYGEPRWVTVGMVTRVSTGEPVVPDCKL